jgi:hypothetical protein
MLNNLAQNEIKTLSNRITMLEELRLASFRSIRSKAIKMLIIENIMVVQLCIKP